MAGVSFTPPPASLLEQATALVSQMAEKFPADKQGGVIAIATDKGWNAAIVHRVGDNLRVAGFIGKAWGTQLTGGAVVKLAW